MTADSGDVAEHCALLFNSGCLKSPDVEKLKGKGRCSWRNRHLQLGLGRRAGAQDGKRRGCRMLGGGEQRPRVGSTGCGPGIPAALVWVRFLNMGPVGSRVTCVDLFLKDVVSADQQIRQRIPQIQGLHTGQRGHSRQCSKTICLLLPS